MSGGTIPDRGYFALRTADTKALLGELDEEFVWERAIGDSFIMGTQGWRIQKIDHQSVEVVPVEARTAMSPFWKAEERNRTFHLSDRIARALEEWNPRLADKGLPRELAKTLRPGGRRGAGHDRFPGPAAGGDTGQDLPHGTTSLWSTRGTLRAGGGGADRAAHPVGREGEQALQPRALGGVGGEVRLPARDAPGR